MRKEIETLSRLMEEREQLVKELEREIVDFHEKKEKLATLEKERAKLEAQYMELLERKVIKYPGWNGDIDIMMVMAADDQSIHALCWDKECEFFDHWGDVTYGKPDKNGAYFIKTYSENAWLIPIVEDAVENGLLIWKGCQPSGYVILDKYIITDKFKQKYCWTSDELEIYAKTHCKRGEDENL